MLYQVPIRLFAPLLNDPTDIFILIAVTEVPPLKTEKLSLKVVLSVAFFQSEGCCIVKFPLSYVAILRDAELVWLPVLEAWLATLDVHPAVDTLMMSATIANKAHIVNRFILSCLRK